jgi:putative DNA primase/helicase
MPFDYEAAAPMPRAWRQFLKQLWSKDWESRKALAQWFGYVISGRLDLQKILLVVGPPRGGKGIIGRILAGLIGPKNVAAPTLASLSGEFGLAPLIGKPLALISDARLTGRAGGVVIERLLSISGEDYLTVNIKYREQWTGKLPSRLMVISNELPEFGDTSTAIVHRFIVLMLTTSWLGKEDIDLEDTLRADLPGILNWALMGLDQLQRKSRFTQPKRSRDAIMTLVEMASPMRVFLRDACEEHPDYRIATKELFEAYCKWAEENGHKKIVEATFGRDLRAVRPGISRERPRDKEKGRQWLYVGIKLITPEPELNL